jgi:putative nucleotidyltransferase with HDIG domain
MAESLVRTPRKSVGLPVSVSLLFFVIATLIVYFPRITVPYQEGDRPVQALRARVAFSTQDQDQLHAAQDLQRHNSPPVIVLNREALNQIRQQLLVLQINVGNMEGDQIPPAIAEQFPGINAASIKALREMRGSGGGAEGLYQNAVENLLTRLESAAIIDTPTTELLAKKSVNSGGLVGLAKSTTFDDREIKLMLRGDLITLGDASAAKLEAVVRQDNTMPMPLWKPIAAYLARLKTGLFTYNEKLSASYAEFRALTASTSSVQFEEHQIIVPAGKPIDKTMLDQLKAAQEAYEADLAGKNPWFYWYSHLGVAVAVGVLTTAGALYVSTMNPQSKTAGRAWSMCALLLVTLFIAKNAAVILPQATFLISVAPTLLATIILIIVFNPRFALAIASIHGLLVTLAINQGFDFFLAMMTGIAIFAFGLREIRTRAKLIEVGVFAAIGLFIAVWALGLARLTGSIWSANPVAQDLGTVSRDSLQAAGAGVLVGFITLGILPFVERVFKMTTAMTLLELCDANRPLLRRLAQEAPGTFNHSLTVGIMAEAAADAIAANGLLCRAGAYYHDVGKLSKPQYFVENQAGGPNRHDKLSPAMSLLIIVGHVKDGVELAREYGLPWSLHQFIAQHHGTTLVEYFFHAARRRQEESGGDNPEIREAEFRYPGPKPQTKEVAILMICDGVESIVRSIPDKSPGRIETAVHGLIMKRLLDGQFSECDLTLRELSQIEAALTKALAGIYHGRVQYPAAAQEATAQTA